MTASSRLGEHLYTLARVAPASRANLTIAEMWAAVAPVPVGRAALPYLLFQRLPQPLDLGGQGIALAQQIIDRRLMVRAVLILPLPSQCPNLG